MILVLVLLAEQSCVVACAASVSFAFGTTTIFVAQLLERWSVSVHARGAMVWRCFFHRGHHRMLRRCVCYHRQRSAGNRRRRRPRRRQNHRRSPQALGRPFASAGIHIVAFRLPEILLSAKTFAVTAANRVAPGIRQPVQSMDGAAKGTTLPAPPPGPFGPSVLWQHVASLCVGGVAIHNAASSRCHSARAATTIAVVTTFAPFAATAAAYVGSAEVGLQQVLVMASVTAQRRSTTRRVK